MVSEIGKPQYGADSPLEYDRQQSCGDLVILAARLYARSLLARISPSGVTRGQWPFLVVLWEEDGISQRELSERRGIREATTVRAIDRMEKEGLVVRERDPNDRRRLRVYLTDRGRALREELLPYTSEVNQVSTHSLTTRERDEFVRLLHKVITELDRDSRAHNQEPPSRI